MKIGIVDYWGIEHALVTDPLTGIRRPTREIWLINLDDIDYVYYIFYVYKKTILVPFPYYTDPYNPHNLILYDIELPLDIANPQATLDVFHKLLMLQ